MSVPRHHYNPTPEQRVQLKRHAAAMRGRIRAMRSLRDTTSGFTRLAAGMDAARVAMEDFRALGWSDSAAGELSEIHVRLNGSTP